MRLCMHGFVVGAHWIYMDTQSCTCFMLITTSMMWRPNTNNALCQTVYNSAFKFGTYNKDRVGAHRGRLLVHCNICCF